MGYAAISDGHDERIRTSTGRNLSPVPLPLGYAVVVLAGLEPAHSPLLRRFPLPVGVEDRSQSWESNPGKSFTKALLSH